MNFLPFKIKIISSFTAKAHLLNRNLSMSKEIKKQLMALGDEKKAKAFSRFFQSKPGDYGEGDLFLGVPMPVIRNLIKEKKDQVINMEIEEIRNLLSSSYHEERMTGTLILVYKYSAAEEEKWFFEYILNVESLNNWDFIDVSAHLVVGHFLFHHSGKFKIIPKELLLSLLNNKWKEYLEKEILVKNPQLQLDFHRPIVSSRVEKFRDLWPRRVALVSTLYFIRKNDFGLTLDLVKNLLINIDINNHHLLHKAAGWMLREIWKRDNKVIERFLSENKEEMPRVMLRYAIERMDVKKRSKFLI
jgi:3-methyladenine DNA glycosylase AlkD